MTMVRAALQKKLIFVNRFFDPDQSATSQMLTDLARGLAARGFAVHVVCSQQLYGDPDARLAAHETREGVVIHRVATTRFGRGRLLGRAVDYASFYVSAGVALLGRVDAGDVLIAKTDPPLISIVAAVIGRLKGAPLINWQQDVFPEVASHLGVNPLPRVLDTALRYLRDWSLRSARMNVLIGERMLEYFGQRGIPASKLCVIDNWADGEAIAPKPCQASVLRERLGLAGRSVFGYSGNLGRAHEFDTLLAAATELRHDHSIMFLMIGGGAKMEALRAAVAIRSLGNFLFLPYQPREQLEDSLSAADVHLVSLLPALEGLILPSKLYGILAAGRPLIFIGDADGDTARIIRNANCGVTVQPGAGEDLVVTIRRLISEPETRTAMGERARSIFLSRYRLDSAIDRWIAVLEVST